ncbi:hypothetical protein D6M20_00460 (plasmid) [Rhodococcus qingshengii]|nr:hypothetical protein D6M20_00460 [Rhodococcus qingshengii]
MSWICDSSVLLAQGTHRAYPPPAVDGCDCIECVYSFPSQTRARYSIFVVSDIRCVPFFFG